MLGRRKRSLSQRSYQIVQAIHAENERLRQIDRGLGYGHATPSVRTRVIAGKSGNAETPLHIGPTIEAVRGEDGWAA